MKYKLLFSSSFIITMQNLLLFFTILTGFVNSSHTIKRSDVSNDLKVAFAFFSSQDPILNIMGLNKDTSTVTAYYTKTKISLNSNVSTRVKEEFFKKHNAYHCYLYSNEKVKIVYNEKMEISLRLEKSELINKNSITNLRTNS